MVCNTVAIYAGVFMRHSFVEGLLKSAEISNLCLL